MSNFEIDIVEHNKKAWDILSQNNDQWTIPITAKELSDVYKGEWKIYLTDNKEVPHNWLKGIEKLKVLCLAGAGGQQAPILSALGAEVTLVDNSNNQIQKDRIIAEKYGLDINFLEADMRDLSCFENESFDLVFNPISTMYVADIKKVFSEVYRVLKVNGIYMAGFINPFRFVFKNTGKKEKDLEVCYHIPFDLFEQYNEKVVKKLLALNYRISYGHSLDQIIGEQLRTGFIMRDFYEDIGDTYLDKYICTEFATYCRKV